MRRKALESIGLEQSWLRMSCIWKFRGKSISLPLDCLFLFCSLVCLAYFLHTNKWKILKLYYPSTIITDLWAREIAQKSTNAIKSNYFSVHLEMWAVKPAVSQYSEHSSSRPPAHLPSLWVQKVYSLWNQRRHSVCLKIGGLYSFHWWNFVSFLNLYLSLAKRTKKKPMFFLNETFSWFHFRAALFCVHTPLT